MEAKRENKTNDNANEASGNNDAKPSGINASNGDNEMIDISSGRVAKLITSISCHHYYAMI